jgi:hypothetical protein
LKLRGRVRSGRLCPVYEGEALEGDEDRELGYLREAKWGAHCVDTKNNKEWVGEVLLDHKSTYDSVQSQDFVDVLSLIVSASSSGFSSEFFLSAVVIVPTDEKAETFRRIGLYSVSAKMARVSLEISVTKRMQR